MDWLFNEYLKIEITAQDPKGETAAQTLDLNITHQGINGANYISGNKIGSLKMTSSSAMTTPTPYAATQAMTNFTEWVVMTNYTVASATTP